MEINKSYKTELDPNNKQKTLLTNCIGLKRFTYNWALNRKNQAHIMNYLPVPKVKYPNAMDLHKELNKIKETKYSWMYNFSKCIPQEALRD